MRRENDVLSSTLVAVGRRIRPEAIWKLSSELYHKGHRSLPTLLKLTNYLLYRALLPPQVKIGRHLRLDHLALGVVIHAQVEIGNHCRIYHHVTLAATTPIGSPYKVILGNRVTIGAHSIVVARRNKTLTIGDGAYIGAGSVLTKDVPAGEVWAGNPARKLGETVPYRTEHDGGR
ncbi:MAG: serine acetyltransferase [Chthoniobacterales bacterium]